MAARHAHAESGVGAQIGAVAQDVPDGHHAPVAVSPRLQPFLVETAGDEAYAQALLEVEAEDVADDYGLLRHQLQAATDAHLVAVGGASQHLAPDGLAAHGGADAIAEALAVGVLGPGSQELLGGVLRAVREGNLGPQALDLEVAAGHVAQGLAQALQAGHDNDDKALVRLSKELRQLPEARGPPVVGRDGVDEGGDGLVALLLTEVEEGGALGR